MEEVMIIVRSLVVVFVLCVGSCAHQKKSISQTPPSWSGKPVKLPLADVHFHLRNYIQEGITLEQAHDILKKKGVKRAAVFGIPLQQRWDRQTGVVPSYYLHDDQALYYYSAIDAIVAVEYQNLSAEKRKIFDPMIVGFNPTDGYGVDHIRRMLLKFPNTFTGIGEFSIKKEVVSSKVVGGAANIEDPALDQVLEFAAEVGLVVILHCDVDAMIPRDKKQPTYLSSLEQLFKRHKKTKIIWAHTGLGRYVKAGHQHTAIISKLLSQYPNLYVDISWDVVVQQFFVKDRMLPQWRQFLQAYSSKIIFGTDVVAPTLPKYEKTLNLYDQVWKELSPLVVERIAYGNYKKLFDRARVEVRQWEQKNLK